MREFFTDGLGFPTCFPVMQGSQIYENKTDSYSIVIAWNTRKESIWSRQLLALAVSSVKSLKEL